MSEDNYISGLPKSGPYAKVIIAQERKDGITLTICGWLLLVLLWLSGAFILGGWLNDNQQVMSLGVMLVFLTIGAAYQDAPLHENKRHVIEEPFMHIICSVGTLLSLFLYWQLGCQVWKVMALGLGLINLFMLQPFLIQAIVLLYRGARTYAKEIWQSLVRYYTERKPIMFKEIGDSISGFLREYRDILFWGGVLFLADHFFLEGAFRDRIKALFERGLKAVEDKVDSMRVVPGA